MSINVFLVDRKGDSRPISICLSDTIGNTKNVLKETNAIWKFDGEVLKNERTFQSYDIEKNDKITTNSFHQGGINNK